MFARNTTPSSSSSPTSFHSAYSSWSTKPLFLNNHNMTTPRPKWFVTRGPGVYTALIPVDELPYSVNLQGVPRTMTGDQVVGMTLVAGTGPPQHRYLLDRQSPFPGQTLTESAPEAPVTPPSKFFAPDAHVSSNGNLSQQALAPVISGVTKLVEKPSVSPNYLLYGCQMLTRPTDRPHLHP